MIETADVELVSLEDAEAPDVADDETAASRTSISARPAAKRKRTTPSSSRRKRTATHVSGLLDGTPGGKEEDEEP